MAEGLYTMSQKEVDRLEIIQKILGKQLSQVNAATLLGVSPRQIRTLKKRYLSEGAKGLVSKRRGKASNNQLPSNTKQQAIELLRLHYPDFGPTFAHEKLTEKHGLNLSVESVRKLMISSGLWSGKQRKIARIHPSRARRSCLGELVQADGSTHDWFEGRNEACCLLVFIDDATSRLMTLLFVEVECLEGYFAAVRQYVKQHGRPLAFYTDKHGIFRVNTPEAKSGTGETQFGRAMRELGIELICANTPQAKGRVERMNGSLQDRLIKELRLRTISNMAQANAFLPEFIEDYNRRFAKAATDLTNAHRSTLPDEPTLQLILTPQYTRSVSKNLEISYKNRLYQIQSTTPSYAMRGARITVCDNADNVILLYKGKSLPYKVLDKRNQPTVIVDTKQLHHLPQRHNKPKPDHPWRQYSRIQQHSTPAV